MAILESVNVGLPKDVAWQGRTVHTGIWKAPVDGPRMVRRLNVDGDGQGDLGGHGGEQRAVFVYQTRLYRHWAGLLRPGRLHASVSSGRTSRSTGSPDDEVCIGDRYRIGEAEFEVTQPRVTCFRVGHATGRAASCPRCWSPTTVRASTCASSPKGEVQAGDAIVRTRVGPHGLSVADVDALLYLPERDLAHSSARRSTSRRSARAGSSRSGDLLGRRPTAPSRRRGSPRRRRSRHGRVPAAAGRPRSCRRPPTVIVGLSGRRGRRPTARAPRRPVPDAAAGRRRPPATGAQLLAVLDPGRGVYRISVKREPHGCVSPTCTPTCGREQRGRRRSPRRLRARPTTTARCCSSPPAIGATPVLAMLHQLAAARSPPRGLVDPRRAGRARPRLPRGGPRTARGTTPRA